MTELLILIFVAVLVLWFVRDIISSILLFAAIFILAWFVWYITGGVDRFEKSNQGIFIRPSQDYRSFETYGEFPTLPQSK